MKLDYSKKKRRRGIGKHNLLTQEFLLLCVLEAFSTQMSIFLIWYWLKNPKIALLLSQVCSQTVTVASGHVVFMWARPVSCIYLLMLVGQENKEEGSLHPNPIEWFPIGKRWVYFFVFLTKNGKGMLDT